LIKTPRIEKEAVLDEVFRYHTNSEAGGFTHGWASLYEKYKQYRFESLRLHFFGDSVLEIGPAEGDMTAGLMEYFIRVAVVEGSKESAKQLRKRFKTDGLVVHEGLIENLRIKETFDTIVLSHVLEHLTDPIQVLRNLQTCMSDDGVLLVMVPNADSIHRHIGTLMGMLPDVYALNEVDVNIGHRRVYDFPQLEKEFARAGYDIVDRGGMFIKPLSNRQMVEAVSDSAMDAFFKLGNRFPEISCEIFVVAKKRQ